jgi:hypothetical protein
VTSSATYIHTHGAPNSAPPPPLKRNCATSSTVNLPKGSTSSAG